VFDLRGGLSGSMMYSKDEIKDTKLTERKKIFLKK
jgi:hypothetical protein